jgi:tellurite resistance protein
MFFIIFGTRGVTSTKEQGQFHCPHCGPGSNYRLKSVRRFFTLYFIPLIPLDSLGQYVECAQCQGTYNDNVLAYESGDEERRIEAMYMVAMKQVMIAMLLADGVIDDAEVKELQDIFEQLAGVEVSEQDLREEIAVIQAEGSSALEMMAAVAPTLNDSGKEKVITAAYRIAMADGTFDDSESEFLSDISAALDVSAAHLRGIMSEVMD